MNPNDEVQPGCLHELFEAQVDRHPGALALVAGKETLTYGELEARVNRLARYLRSRGCGPGKFVGLYFERSAQSIVAILAALKSGAAYVPIDPTYPVDRIRHILEESEAVLLLTENALLERAADLFTPVAAIDQIAEELTGFSDRRLSPAETGLTPVDLCYVIYTSGTTGRPKGVMAEHRNAYLYALAFNAVCGTGPEDRIYQGFSLSFDGSIEEIWMAFSNGSALVVGDRETPRFGNELADFLVRNRVTYFSTVPTLLTTISTGISTLHTLVLSGEVCPPELVNRWARPELRLLNVYGPTEATVNTTAVECFAGQPVTIGRALPGYDLFILDANLAEVAPGEKGELFVGGPTLARGYLKQPRLSAERFVERAGARLYRTGDLVRLNAEGNLEFFGRIDSQVKIRGYRVELAEIESILLEESRIRSASVKLVEQSGLQELAAYVVLKDPFDPLDRVALLAGLESRLPPYMIPGYLDVVGTLPVLTSGKVDRARLPAPIAPLVRVGTEMVEPEGDLERQIAAIWARIFKLPKVSVEDDFFLDLGGHSLVAAQMVTQLRAESAREVSVRDAYGFPTIRKLTRHLEEVGGAAAADFAEPTSREVFEAQPAWIRRTTQLLQAVSIYGLYAFAMIPFGLTFMVALAWWRDRVSLTGLILAYVAIALLTWPVMLALSVAAKWLVIGRYRAGKYPLWSFYFFRWWLVNRIQAFGGAGALVGTPVLPIYLRLMGAQVGARCTLDSAMGSVWDLLSIGDDVSIGADTQYLGYKIENGILTIGRIEIGARSFLGIHSALGVNSRMGDDTCLDDQSLLPEGSRIPDGEARRGSPAKIAEIALPAPAARSSRRRRFAFGVLHLALADLLGIFFLIPAIPFFVLWYFTFTLRGLPFGAISLALSVPVGFAVYALFVAAVKRVAFNHAPPGVYRVESLFYVRKWISDGLMKSSRAILLPLYTTLYLPPWLRLMGAKIGARAELSTVWNFAPELIDVGEESFFADGSIIGGKRIYRGSFEIAMNRIGRRSFVGNSAILPVGKGLGNGCLLGVQSIPPADCVTTPDGTDWLGSPAFSLPHRQKVGNFDSSLTFRPTRSLYLQRAVIDGLRILIPGYVAMAAAVVSVIALYQMYARIGVAAMFALAPFLGVALGVASALFVVALKWAVMGRFGAVIKPLWSRYVWLNEMVNGAYESVMTPAITPFLGTPWIAVFFRLLGCRIGKHTYMETTLFSEWDLVEVGDYASLGLGAVIQTHLFEDRVMKSSSLKIGENCSVGNMAVILYDSEMQKRASLGPLSLLMKGEVLSSAGKWHGIPTSKVSRGMPKDAAAAPRAMRFDFTGARAAAAMEEAR